jgi:mono/diheme cytochrome c family protein
MKFFKIIIVVGILLGGGAIFIWSGVYDVAATVPHWTLTKLLLEGIREQSVAYHSKGIQPPSLEDPQMISSGFEHFHTTCRLCHGAPGTRSLEFASGMNPSPPDLKSIEVQEESDGELYWIVKNGIKMTGMPAFGPTHNEKQLWEIVAFLRQLPDLTPGDYRSMVQATKVEKETTPQQISRPPQ